MTTWNESDKSSTVFISGGLTASSTGTSAGAVRSTDAVNVGKIYFEVFWQNGTGSGTACGITRASAAIDAIGVIANGALVYANGSVWFNGSSTGISLWGGGSIDGTICFAVDFTASRLWARLNGGNWNNDAGANPATNTGGIDISAMFPTNAAYACATFNSASPTTTINFGANTFAYGIPSGFAGWTVPPGPEGSADAGLNRTLAALTLSGFGNGPAAPTVITWDAANKHPTQITLSGGNKIATSSAGSGTTNAAVRATQAISTTRKEYFEITVSGTVGQYLSIGIVSGSVSLTGNMNIGGSSGAALGNRLNAGQTVTYINGVVAAGTVYTNFSSGNVIRIAVDRAANKMWWANGNTTWSGSAVWIGSGGTTDDPATGTGGANISAVTGAIYPAASSAWTGDVCTINGGDTAFAYAVPSGFVGISAPLASSDARLTQVAQELWLQPLADARLTQVALELWGSVATTTVGTGALTATFGTATLAATGVLSTPVSYDRTGTLTRTLGPLTIVAAGRRPSGQLEPFTFQNTTLVATATLKTGGILNQTLAPLLLNPPATGAEKFGSLDATLAPLTLAGLGTSLSGRLDAILAALTLAGTGGVAKTGKLEDRKPLAALTLSGHAAVANRGTLGATLGPARMLALGGLSSVAPGTPGVVSQQMFFFAWTDEASVFDSSMLREDESVFSFELAHEEADFPSLRLDLKNPKVGLLAAGRNVWCWFSWRDPASGLIEPLFHGRLIGIPEDLHDEVVRLQFVARPSNYIEWKNIVAEGLKGRPFWDPVWIAEGDTDPDTVLEARPSAWHIDRVSLAVTASDTIIGEDGTLAITADDHFYDALKISYGDTPLRRVDVTGTVTWTQEGTGVVDITRQVYDQFVFAGSPYEYPMVSSFTGDGLLSDWPGPGDSIGGGWSMDATALALQATWQNAWLLSIAYVSPVLSTAQEVITPGYYQWGGGWAGAGIMGWKPAVTRDREFVSAHETIGTVFPLLPISTTFTVRWEASRARTEIVRFSMTADTQPLLVDPGDDETDKIDLSSDFVGQPVDPGGALPLGSLLRNSYFNTDRGSASVEYLIMLARAKMLARARAVSLSVETPFGFATRLSCRQNATVFDPRLPGGQGTGKVTRYALSIDGDSGEAKAEITLGCTIGRGQTVTPDPGEETYGEPDWSNDYQAMDGATLDAGTGDILYESFDDLDVVDDDGLDLMRMTPDRVIQALTVWDGPDTQQNTLNSFYRMYTPPGVEQLPPEMGVPVGTYSAPETPTEMLSKIPTVVDLQLVPISNQSFETTWEPAVSALMVPKTIDLEAPYP